MSSLIHIAPTFTPLVSTVGGMMIGSAAALQLRLAGRILGTSGCVRNPISWRSTCLAGLSVGGSASAYFMGSEQVFHGVMEMSTALPVAVPIVSGLLVGFGTSLANGCTSGHGVSGLARFSKRSLAAVGTFMSSAMVTASAINHYNLLPIPAPGLINLTPTPSLSIAIVSSIGLAVFARSLWLAMRAPKVPVVKGTEMKPATETPPATEGCKVITAPDDNVPTVITAFGTGSLFGVGLVVSGMCDPLKVLGFLTPMSPFGWDPSLAFVMMGALAVNTPATQFRPPTPKFRKVYDLPTSTAITGSLILGSILFGIGWGIYGACPGPAVVNVASGSVPFLTFVAFIVLGARGALVVERWWAGRVLAAMKRP